MATLVFQHLSIQNRSSSVGSMMLLEEPFAFSDPIATYFRNFPIRRSALKTTQSRSGAADPPITIQESVADYLGYTSTIPATAWRLRCYQAIASAQPQIPTPNTPRWSPACR